MNCREFEQYVQQHLERDEGGEREASVWSLPAPMIVHAGDCPACAQFYTDLRWLLEQTRHLPAPAPSADFAERVVAQVTNGRGRPAVSLSGQRPVLRRVGAWSLLAAASVVLLAQLAGPQSGTPMATSPAPMVVVAAPGSIEPAPVPETLASSLTSEPELLPTPAIGKAVLASTATFMNAGKEVGGDIQPITASAIGAFDYLWKDLPNPAGKPSS